MPDKNATGTGGPVSAHATKILLVEDNIADIELLKLALRESSLIHQLYVVMDGEKAIDFLAQRGEYAQAPHPDLILLDLNLPRKSGIEVLADIKRRVILKRIPVVVLTSSVSDSDINAAYDFGANAYMRKASNLDEIFTLVRAIQDYWLGRVTLPAT
jgi:two-component system, chemotaxis family, response regulator Rcp1